SRIRSCCKPTTWSNERRRTKGHASTAPPAVLQIFSCAFCRRRRPADCQRGERGLVRLSQSARDSELAPACRGVIGGRKDRGLSRGHHRPAAVDGAAAL